jgi:hypothetical protein
MEEEEVEPHESGKLRHWQFQIQTLRPELRQDEAALTACGSSADLLH